MKNSKLEGWLVWVSLGCLCALPAAADWPQFRGPGGSGVAAEDESLSPSWPEAGPKVLWRKALGDGFATPVAAGDAIYVLAGDAEGEFAVRFDPASGEEDWRTPIGPLFEEAFGNGPRSTPTVDGDVLFALSSTGMLSALSLKDGAVRWQVDAGEAWGAKVPQRGFCPSPLVVGDLLILEIGGSEGRGIVALDKANGKARWSHGEYRTGYSTPVVATIDGVEQLIFAHSTVPFIEGVDLKGKSLWKHEWPPGTIAMPVFVPPNRVLVSATADVGAVLLEIARQDGEFAATEVWRNRLLKNHFSSSLVLGGEIYGFDNGTLKCLDAATGEQCWAKRGFGKGSLIAADGKLVVLGDRGQLALVEATPEAYKELGSMTAFESKTWSSPALTDGRLLLRDQAEILCLEVGERG
ncbi:MAG: PQQ-binding-like beta-propeller repeat protein [Acidobacteriota bacterium]